MGREKGFAAMDAEAKRLLEGKEPSEEGTVREIDGSYSTIWPHPERSKTRHVFAFYNVTLW